MRDVESILMQRLMSDEELTALVGVRIFPLVRPQEDDSPERLADLPAVVYQRVSTGYLSSHELDSGDLGNAQVQYSVFAETRREARKVAELVRRSLRAYRDLSKGIQRVSFSNVLEQYEQDTGIYHVVMTAQVMYPEQ